MQERVRNLWSGVKRTSSQNAGPSLEGLQSLLQGTRFEDQPEIQRLIQIASSTNNSSIAERARKALAIKISRHQLYPFTSDRNPVPIPMKNQVQLGHTRFGNPYSINEHNLTRHLLTVGQSGTGKTTLFYHLTDQASVPFWIFDLKQDYRHVTQERDDLLVLPWTELKFNPVKPPPGVSPRRWIQVFSEIFGHSTALLSGSKNYLMKNLVQLYRYYNLFNQVSEPYPSLHELQEVVEADKINYVRKTSNYRDTVLNRLETMNLTAGTVFDCSQGFELEELLKRNVVFEFDGLSRDVQNFLMEILFAYVYEYRLAHSHRGDDLRHLFFLDEGKRVFSVYKERQDASGIPEIDELTSKMREFGEGLIVADQEASKLTDSIKANTFTKVLLPTGDRKQFNAVADSMNLSERQAEYAQDLEIGEAIVQVGNQDPIPVSLPEYEVQKQITDNVLEQNQVRRWKQLSHRPREKTPEFGQAVFSGSSRRGGTDIPGEPDSEIELSSDADRLLADIAENPFRPLSKRYENFSSTGKGGEAKEELVDNGLVTERHVRAPDHRRKLLEFTDKGRQYVEEKLDLEIDWPGKGGVIHRYWQEKIMELFEAAGWKPLLEKFDSDVYVHMGACELYIEIAMGNNEREIEHVLKRLDSNSSVVWLIARNQQILDSLKQKLTENNLQEDRVALHTLQSLSESEIPLGG